MPLKYPATKDELKVAQRALVEAKRKEDAWWALHGYPEYSSSDESGMANAAHRAWVKCVEKDGSAYNSPMARKMFILGWLKGGGKLWDQPQTGGREGE